MSDSSQFPLVAILLSTFNGEKYLDEQIRSLFHQTYPNLVIIVRDDGSQDGTLNVLKTFEGDARLKVLASHHNIGPAASFMQLLSLESEADFFAFCDQDDIWLPTKIEVAINALQKKRMNSPSLYCSRVSYVSEENQLLGLSAIPNNLDLGNALVENVVTGCTIVMNRQLRDLLITNLPQRFMMHDAWVYLVASSFGEIFYDQNSYIRYRQHSSNTVGVALGFFENLIKRLKRFTVSKKGAFRFSDQAVEFLNVYGKDLSKDQRLITKSIVESKFSFIKRVSFFFNGNIYRQSYLDNIILRILVLINRY